MFCLFLFTYHPTFLWLGFCIFLVLSIRNALKKKFRFVYFNILSFLLSFALAITLMDDYDEICRHIMNDRWTFKISEQFTWILIIIPIAVFITVVFTICYCRKKLRFMKKTHAKMFRTYTIFMLTSAIWVITFSAIGTAQFLNLRDNLVSVFALTYNIFSVSFFITLFFFFE